MDLKSSSNLYPTRLIKNAARSELIYSDEPITSEAIAALIADVRILLTPDEAGNDFAVKYDAAFQRNPDVVLAHADLVTLLATKVQL